MPTIVPVGVTEHEVEIPIASLEIPAGGDKVYRMRCVAYSGMAHFAVNFEHSKLRGSGSDDATWVEHAIRFSVGSKKWSQILGAAPMLAPAGMRLDDSDETDDTGWSVLPASFLNTATLLSPARFTLSGRVHVRGGRNSSMLRISYSAIVLGLSEAFFP